MMLLPLLLMTLQNPVAVTHDLHSLVVDNGAIKLTIDQNTGLFSVVWTDHSTIAGISGNVRTSTGKLMETTSCPRHVVEQRDIETVRDPLGQGVKVTLHHRSNQGPELRHVFWVYDQKPEVFIQLQAISNSPISTNRMTPIDSSGPVTLASHSSLQSLFVPYDNDMYFRYRSDGWGEGDGDGDGSYEVGSLYDNATRNGIVIGSIDHDEWKSAVRFVRGADGTVKTVHAVAGVTSKYTHDTQPHGSLQGTTVSSPRWVIGRYDDWRMGMERYGKLNALVKPALPWPYAVPVGWNSWSGHKDKLKYADTQAAIDFFAESVPQLRADGTAFINLDSFWDNLKPEQLTRFVRYAHQHGLRAGIYWTPFTTWGGLDDPVRGDQYTYHDLALKGADGKPVPQLDGGWALDPTHPGTLARIDRQMAEFVQLGFDFVKLDFLSHGALEGVHANPKIRTGTAAYAFGMQRLLDQVSEQKIHRPFFISLSIAPMFPHGYGHSRRISCDAFANIGATEYMLNSQSYGWWTQRTLYAINDPDHTVVYQALGEHEVSGSEGRCRMTASVISGGMLLEGDDLTKAPARKRAQELFSNQEIVAVAQKALAFHAVEGNTGTVAADTFVAKDGEDSLIAVFNYSSQESRSVKLDLARAGLEPNATYEVLELWTHAGAKWTGNPTIELPAATCRFYRVRQA